MEELIKLQRQGLNDSQISEILNIPRKKIWYERSKLKLKSNFSYKDHTTIDYDLFKKYIENGLNDVEIAEKLNTTKDSIYAIRKRNNFYRESFSCDKHTIITQRQLEILTGTLLGDSSLKMPKDGRNPSFSCEHGINQEDYCFSKFKEFESMGAKFQKHKRKTVDLRTGIFYESSTVRIGAKTNFLEMYKHLYINGTKRITENFLENFSSASLAYLFMDDGARERSGYKIALMCFPKEDLELFRLFCVSKFGFDFSIYKDGMIYVPSKYKDKFTELIMPYIHKKMMYKVHVQVS